MNFDDAQPGHPFGDDYRGHHKPTPEMKRAVGRQVADLKRRLTDQSQRHRLIRELQRRCDGNHLLVRMSERPRDPDFAFLWATGEILVSAEWYDRDEIRRYVEERGLVRVPPDCAALAGRVVRLVRSDPTRPRHRPAGPDDDTPDRLARDLRDLGADAAPNYIVPLAPVGKGLDGPEPGTTPGPFAGYPVPHGSGSVPVGIIDTGITPENRGDGWLALVPRGIDVDPLDVLPGGGDGRLDLQAGHGTFVAGALQQVAPGADIRVYKAMDSDGRATDMQVACAMLRAVSDGCRILNLSFGCQTDDDVEPVAMAAAIDAIPADVVMIAAAGNYGTTTKVWPAAFPRVTAVAGLTAGLTPADWSSRGDWVAMSTVGEGIGSTYVKGQESALVDPNPDTFGFNAWAIWSGTSFAAPQVAGAVARMCLEDPQLTPADAVQLLAQAGVPIPDFGQAVEILPGL
jgi:hypothetical protein